jgi:hypothetical protein
MNRTKTAFLASAAALILTAGIAMADDANKATSGAFGSAQTAKAAQSAKNGATPQTPTMPNSNDNYYDDRLRYSIDVSVLSYPDAKTQLCVPAFTKLMGRSKTIDTITDPSDSSKSLSLVEVQIDPWADQIAKSCARDDKGKPLTYGSDGKPMKDANGSLYGLASDGTTHVSVTSDTEQDALPPGKPAYIPADLAGNADTRSGFDFGALAVPFKMQMSGKQAFTTSASLGGYLGYRLPLADTGLVFSPIVFAGASNISTQVTKGSKTTSQTDAALSYGAGIVTTVKDSIQVGLVVGFDHVDSAQPYAYQDKPWISLEVGYSFAQ